MSELSSLKKENKQLKGLLKNAVELLDKYKEVLKHPEKFGLMEETKKKAKKSDKRKASKKPSKPAGKIKK
jgi:hypothetical protein